MSAFGAALTTWAIIDGAIAAATVLASAVALVVARSLWECGTSSAVLIQAVSDCEAQRGDSRGVAASVPLPTAAVVAEPPLKATG
jgi:hypothetical protein